MNEEEEVTPVVFRRWPDGDIMALFPFEASTVGNPYECASYAHIGQHSGAEPNHCIYSTRPATEAEYADLKRELESEPFGYRLKVIKRVNHSAALAARREQLREGAAG